jgi:hypothetical protein
MAMICSPRLPPGKRKSVLALAVVMELPVGFDQVAQLEL